MLSDPAAPPSSCARGRRAFAHILASLVVASCAHSGAAPRARGGAAAPADWHRYAVVYGVVPPMFGPRPLRAVAARLDDLRDLGVDALWLAPITDTDDRGAISYAVTDYFHVRPDFGSEDDLRFLVSEAHARGLRVLLDVVPNHTSEGHPFYRDAEARGRASPYYAYYLRDEEGRATHDFDWVHLKKLDFRNPEVRRLVTEAFAYWVREFGVDGFRVDAAWGVRDRAPDFWPELTAALRRIRPDLFLVAEASARDAFYVRSGFDASYDWTEELGRWAWEHVFDHPARIGPALDAALASDATPMDRVFRFLDNNDTGDRFVTRYGVARTRLAAVLLHTLPGVAAVYTGDEICAEFRPYEDPPPLRWVDRCGFRPLYRRLAALREELPALRAGGFRRVKVPGHEEVFAFLRDAGAAGRALVVVNFGSAARLRLELPAPEGAPLGWDALASRPFVARTGPLGTELDMGAESAVVLVPRASAR